MEIAIYNYTPVRNSGIRLMRTIDKLNRWNTRYELALTPDIRTLPNPSVKNVQGKPGALSVANFVDLERGYPGAGLAVFEQSTFHIQHHLRGYTYEIPEPVRLVAERHSRMSGNGRLIPKCFADDNQK